MAPLKGLDAVGEADSIDQADSVDEISSNGSENLSDARVAG